MTQSVVDAYERRRREPSLPVLRRLIEAAGSRLVLGIEREPLLDRARSRRHELIDALEHLGATDIRVFGSVARGDDTPTSDIDLLVHLADDVSLFALGQMHDEAERILRTPVDVVPDTGLKPDVHTSIQRDSVPL